MPLIIPSNSISGEFEVANSLRFDDGSTDNLSRTPTSGNRRTFTYSAWIKLSSTAGSKCFVAHSDGTANNDFMVQTQTSNSNLLVFARSGGSTQIDLQTNRILRDTSAWYHIVVSVDTTQATSTNRVKIYVNGSQQTSFSTNTYPSQNADLSINNSSFTSYVGQLRSGVNNFDGYIAEAILIDGSQLDPTSFGEFDADTGIWKPIDVSGLTFGTNGFYLDFENSGSLGNDKSGNGNNFTVNNLTSIDQTTDTPTNNFCTLNPLDATSSTTNTFSEGNTQMIGNNTTNRRYGSTFAVNKGKWYFEFKQGGSVSSGGACVGIFDIDATNTQSTTFFGLDSNALQIQLQSGSGNVRIYNGSFSTDNYGASASVGDIIMVALDMDNYFMYVGQNGTFLNSGDPTSGSSGTGNINNTGGNVNYSLSGKTFMFGGGVQNTDFQQWNFGNPAFTISSGNSDGNGYGNFEYSVPSGYYALNTKNLAEFG